MYDRKLSTLSYCFGFLCAILSVTTFVSGQAPIRIYSRSFSGADIIDFTSPPIAFASNLMWDPKTTEPNPKIYFTADKGSPNLFVAQFDPKGGNHTFWALAKSPFALGQASAFFSFVTSGQTIVGPSYPSPVINQATAPAFIVQSAFVSGSNYSVGDTPFQAENYTFISSALDPTVSAEGIQLLYLLAWGPKDMVVFRVMYQAGPNPTISFDQTRDIRPIGLNPMCYDQFTPYQLPKMWLTASNLFVSIPGRCAGFVKFTLNTVNDPWVAADAAQFDPTDTAVKYLSCAAFDPKSNIIFYTIKQYNIPGTWLYALDTNIFNNTGQPVMLEIPEGEGMVEVGYDANGTRLVFVAASGGNVIELRTVDNKMNYNLIGVANLDDYFNQVSSLLFITPYLYLTTYEPNAKLLRISKQNFCKNFCGEDAYCNNGKCQCVDGFSPDFGIAGNPCVPTKEVEREIKIKEGQSTSIALGFLFATSAVGGGIGWILYFRSRKSQYQAVESAL